MLSISNVKEKSYLSINWEQSLGFNPKNNNISNNDEEDEWSHNNNINNNNSSTASSSSSTTKSLEIYVNLTGGIGISLVQWLNHEYEELVYAYLKTFEVNFEQSALEQRCLLSIQFVQICNQLFNSLRQNVLLIQSSPGAQSTSTSAPTPSASGRQQQQQQQQQQSSKVLEIDFLRRFRHENIFTIEHLLITVSDIVLQVEEKLLWKIIQFFGIDRQKTLSSESSVLEENFEVRHEADLEQQPHQQQQQQQIECPPPGHFCSQATFSNFYKSQIHTLMRNAQAIKYSFNRFQINGISVSLSVFKSSKLSHDLQKIKSALGIPLIQFENAHIECKPFIVLNEYETLATLLGLMSRHYSQELRAHAIHILGSWDFLGNPLGLMVDFKESLTNVISNGQVADFVFSITHGVANSLSKFSGSLSDELNELTLDENHQETREQIRSIYNNGSIDHFVGGALGFAVGIIGGALSIATQTYRGFNQSGVGGAFTGLGRGAVGTVSKPIVGVLDFATGIASAIRETSKSVQKKEIPRIRETRCCTIPGALLSLFSRSDSNGQKMLYQVNNFHLVEKFIAIEQLNNSINPLIVSIRSLYY